MAMFVHLAFETDIKAILKNGILLPKRQKGIYAMPVTRNFFLSHQWLRELKRRKSGTIYGVYFRVKDDEKVLVGYFNEEHKMLLASEAVAAINSNENHQGYEVIIQRKIKKSEIHKIKKIPQIVGWRYFPNSHGRKPCGCLYCQQGEYGGKKLREKYENE